MRVGTILVTVSILALMMVPFWRTFATGRRDPTSEGETPVPSSGDDRSDLDRAASHVAN